LDLHAYVGAQDGSFLVPRPVLVRGRDFVLVPTRILVEGGEADSSRSPSRRRETWEGRRVSSCGVSSGGLWGYFPHDKPADSGY